MLVAALVLLMAAFRPEICAACSWEITSPAGLSAALLIWRPEDNRSSDVFRLFEVCDRLYCALRDAMFVLMYKLMDFSPVPALLEEDVVLVVAHPAGCFPSFNYRPHSPALANLSPQ